MTTIYTDKKNSLPERHENDLYVTELNLVAAALSNFGQPAKNVLDVGAGDGRWGIGASWLFSGSVSNVDLVDITPQERVFQAPAGVNVNYHVGDFLTWQAPRKYELIVSNPPYFIAEEIVRKSWEMLEPGGVMMYLLRLSFLAGIGRFEGLFRDIPLYKVGVCARRPSFYGGGTNGTDFGMFIWQKNMYGNPHSTGYPNSFYGESFYHARGGGETQEDLLKAIEKWGGE